MSWRDLLFMHWRIPVGSLRDLVPSALEIDTWEGDAWLGVVPFRMAGVRLRWLPPLPGLSAFPELNVRTYVTVEDRPGIWFFSLDAASRSTVAAARRLFHLPYHHARMSCRERGGWIRYESRRTAGDARLAMRYRPAGSERNAAPGSLERFLVERYCLYAADRGGGLHRGEIDHAPWTIQDAEAELETHTLPEALGLRLPEEFPLLHFSRRQDAVAWSVRPVRP